MTRELEFDPQKLAELARLMRSNPKGFLSILPLIREVFVLAGVEVTDAQYRMMERKLLALVRAHASPKPRRTAKRSKK